MKTFKSIRKLSILLSVLMVFITGVAKATTKTSVATGNWNTSGTWSPSGVPAAGDIVIINTTVTLNVNANCASLTINSGKTLKGQTFTINIGGNFTNNGTFTFATSTINFNTGGNSIIGGSTKTTFYNLTINKTTTTATVSNSTLGFIVSNDLTLTQGNMVLSASGMTHYYIVVGNFMVASTGTFTHNASYDNADTYFQVNGDFSINGTYTYTGFTPAIWMNSGGVTATHFINTGTTSLWKLFLRAGDFKANGPVTVNEEFFAMWDSIGGSFHTNGQTVNANWGVVISGGTVYVDGGTLTVGNSVGGMLVGRTFTKDGDLQVSSGTLNVTGGGIYLGTPSSTTPKGTCTQSGGTINTALLDMGKNCSFTQSGGINNLSTLNINYSSSTYSQTTGTPTLNIAGNLTNNGVFSTSTGTDLINIGGNWTNNLTFTTSSTNTVTCNGSANQVIGGTAANTFNNLIINPSAGITVSAVTNNISILSNLTVSSGIFDLGTLSCNRSTSGGTLSVASGATLKLGGGSGGATGSNFPNSFTTNTLNANSTVEYNGSVAQTIYATPTYGHLTLSAGNIKTAGDNLTVAGNLTINSTATFAGSTFIHSIGGNWYNNVSSTAFDRGTSEVGFSGSVAQTIGGTAGTSFYGLVMANTAGVSISAGDAIDVYGYLNYSGTGESLTTNDMLTLKSTATNTAWIGDMTGNTITGKVTVERYIYSHKAWRFLSIPTNTVQTVKQTWQEGCGANLNCVANYGTQITGTGGTAAGFDLYSPAPSMKTYNTVTNSWAGISNTNATIKATDGYMIFIRGDRTATAINSIPTQTVLRTQGDLYTGDQAAIIVNPGKFAAIGNPYASALDMRNITKTGMKNFFYVWDPNLGGSYGWGGYQTFSYNGSDYIITPGLGSYGATGSVSNYIQSGLAFFVQATAGGGSVTLKEGAKTSGSAQVSIPSRLPQSAASVPVGLLPSELRTTLYGVNADNSTYIVDGILNNYGDDYSNSVDDMDAIKSTNSGENLSIKTSNQLLVIERRHSIILQDTISLNLANVRVQRYRFEFIAGNLEQPGLTGYLEDSYLSTRTLLNLSGTTTIDFSVVNVAGSYAVNRFRIVFAPAAVLPLTITSVNVYQVNENIAVEWKVENESNMKQYEVEKSADGNHFTKASTVAANNAAVNKYAWLDAQVATGYNYYRIKSIDINGKIKYSDVVKVFIGKGKQEITVYPNPILNNTINLQLVNQPAGSYKVKLLNNAGQQLLETSIQHAAGSSAELITIKRKLPQGTYQLEVIKPNHEIVTNKVIY